MQKYGLTTKQFIGLSALLLAAMLATFSFAQNKPAPKGAAAQAQQYQITIMRLQPGMAREWQDFMKNEFIPALRKAGVNQLGIWRTATFGEGGEVMITRSIGELARS